MATATPSSKPSAESATVSTPRRFRRYREDPFFRSTVRVALVQALFAFLIILVFAAAILYQEKATTGTIEYQREVVQRGGVVTPGSLDLYLINLRDITFGSVSLVLITLAVVFAFLSTRYALEPTRRSLEYQKRFIGNIAHELRTPLAIIRTNTEVALMDPALNDYARSTFGTTIEELDRISQIINNLLSFDSLLRPGRIHFDTIDLRGAAREVVNRHKAMAESYGIALALDAADEPAYVNGNVVALEQVLTNLIKNALNYTPQHDSRSVIVRIDDNGETIAASVMDTGIGIAQKDLFYVFEPFYRGDTSRARSIGSGTSGLGLAIVNDIVRAHGGSIVIRSALNRGTTIEITLPKAPEALAAEAEAESAAADDEEEHEASIIT